MFNINSDKTMRKVIQNIRENKDYYLIEIKWKEKDGNGDSLQFDDYRKETDLVYVIVKAMQPEPKEETINTTEMTEASE